MPDAFADSDVLIDAMRGLPQAVAWFASLTDLPLLPGFVYMELMGGAQNKADQQKTGLFPSQFRRVWLDAAGMERAAQIFERHHLADNLGLIDALIAATVISQSGTLYTFNKKHFGKITGLTMQQPYTKP